MTVSTIARELGAELLTPCPADEKVTAGYCGDLLSWVMGRAPADSVWVTIMGNRNMVAVALLAGVKAVVLAEGVLPDEGVAQKAAEEGIAILSSPLPAFALAGRLYALLEAEP